MRPAHCREGEITNLETRIEIRQGLKAAEALLSDTIFELLSEQEEYISHGW